MIMTKQEFIDAIAKAADKYASKYGILVISPVIAQACLESAYGTSNKAKHNNFFGLKYRKDRLTCHSGYFKDGSKEQKADGTYYPVADDWYAFDSLDSGVEGYFQYINIERYSNLKGVKDPYKYLELIRADGYATSLNYVKNVWAVVEKWNLTKYDNVVKEENSMGYTNSPLVSYIKLSPNHSGQRTHAIDRITPHCVVGQCSVETLGNIFAPISRQASCNYGIGADGRVGMYVEEKNRSWCSSSNANDQRAITIECASDTTAPYAFKDVVYNKLIELCVDICKRNGKKKLLWLGDKNKTLNYQPKSDEMVLTVHRWFANKSCPGDWLYSRLGDVANRVTAQLSGSSGGGTTSGGNTGSGSSGNYKTGLYKVNVGDLNIRKGPGTNYGTNGVITDKGTYTITEIQNGSWGKLKSGAGWINVSTAYCSYVGAASGGTSSSGGSSASGTAYKTGTYKVNVAELNIRKGPGTNYGTNGSIKDKGVYTITEIKNGSWGKLKSGAGWINVDKAYCTYKGAAASSGSGSSSSGSFQVQVSISDLYIRKGPGTNYGKSGFCPKGVYTIVEEADGAGATKWGKLKSGVGWVSLDYAKRI